MGKMYSPDWLILLEVSKFPVNLTVGCHLGDIKVSGFVRRPQNPKVPKKFLKPVVSISPRRVKKAPN